MIKSYCFEHNSRDSPHGINEDRISSISGFSKYQLTVLVLLRNEGSAASANPDVKVGDYRETKVET